MSKDELKKVIEDAHIDISFLEYCWDVIRVDTENPHTLEYWRDVFRGYIQWRIDNKK